MKRYKALIKAVAILAVFALSLSCGTEESPNPPRGVFTANPVASETPPVYAFAPEELIDFSPIADNYLTPPPLHHPSPAVDTYEYFFNFRLNRFSPKTDPLIKERVGDKLGIKKTSLWEFPSYNSFAVGFAASLPTVSIIEYGETADYGKSSAISESSYYNHLHYLKDLKEGTSYHYRIIVQDEEGVAIASPDRVFTTKTFTPEVKKLRQEDFKHMEGERDGLWITTPGEYVLTEDITSNGLGITIKADDVTLDLNGYTLIYDNGANPFNNDDQYNESASYGIRDGKWNKKNFKIYNGIIKQGAAGTTAHGPLYFVQMDDATVNEIAGLTVDYYSDSAPGMVVGRGYIHHNILYDRGNVVLNRHAAVRALEARPSPNTEAAYNSFRRFRQRGIDGVTFVHDNELYSDSFVVNSFLLGAGHNTVIKNNKLFGMGYHPLGIGWGDNINVKDNLVYMWCFAPTYRDPEYKRHSSVAGVRVTNYDSSNPNFEGMIVEGNYIVLKATNNCKYARGIWTVNSMGDIDITYRHNTIKVEALPDNYKSSDNDYYNDDPDTIIAAITVQGAEIKGVCPPGQGGLDGDCPEYAKWEGEDPIPSAAVFEDNRLISNINHIAIGESYGITSGVRFYRNTFEKIVHSCYPTDKPCIKGKEGNEKFFAPVRIGYWYWNTLKNRVIDSNLVGITEEEFEPSLYGGDGKMEVFYGKSKTFQFLDGGGNPLADKDITLTTQASGIVQTKRTDAAGKAEFELLSVRYYKFGNSWRIGGLPGTPRKDSYSQYTFSTAGYEDYTLTADLAAEQITLSGE